MAENNTTEFNFAVNYIPLWKRVNREMIYPLILSIVFLFFGGKNNLFLVALAIGILVLFLIKLLIEQKIFITSLSLNDKEFKAIYYKWNQLHRINTNIEKVDMQLKSIFRKDKFAWSLNICNDSEKIIRQIPSQDWGFDAILRVLIRFRKAKDQPLRKEEVKILQKYKKFDPDFEI